MKKVLVVAIIFMLMIFVTACDNSQDRKAVGTRQRTETTSNQTEQEECDLCGGSGVQECTWCKGTGSMSAAGTSYACSSCGGTGYMRCLGCLGKGYKPETGGNSVSSGSTGTYDYSGGIVDGYTETKSVCPICGGSGTKVCSSCNGSGEFVFMENSPNYGGGSSSYTKRQRCGQCNGRGKVMCTSCGGDGYI